MRCENYRKPKITTFFKMTNIEKCRIRMYMNEVRLFRLQNWQYQGPGGTNNLLFNFWLEVSYCWEKNTLIIIMSITPGEMTTLSAVLEKLRIKKRDNEFRISAEGFGIGNGKFYIASSTLSSKIICSSLSSMGIFLIKSSYPSSS